MSAIESDYARYILVGLAKWDKHVYGGTVSQVEVEKRRAKNKLARKARSLNRG